MEKGIRFILLTALISGVSIFANAYAVGGFDSSVFTFSKNVVVALLLLSILSINFKQLKSVTKKQWLQLTSIGLVGGSIPFLLFFAGLQMTTGSTSAFIHKTLFVFASIFALLFLKEKMNKWFTLGAALLLTGTYFMLSPSLSFQTGHLLILGATIFWAVENVISKHTLKELSGTVVAWGRMFFGSLFIFAYLLFTNKVSIITSMTAQQFMWIGLTSLFLLGYVYTYYNGLKTVKVSVATSVLAIGAPITLVLQALILDKTLAIQQISGSVIILAGAVFILLTNPDIKESLLPWTVKN